MQHAESLGKKEANTNISFSLLFTSCESGELFFFLLFHSVLQTTLIIIVKFSSLGNMHICFFFFRSKMKRLLPSLCLCCGYDVASDTFTKHCNHRETSEAGSPCGLPNLPARSSQAYKSNLIA